ncbi:adenylate/guanylate cyclase domain-containing protein [Ruegeria sp. Alg231-54]|uniref:adenylate/guanylate cyclase domain-containing protein n=1 Tax=Ruegeria sp. Alg231-54 TaxID=1922221 RepID=UPI000D5593C3|nr:adenylate/guanylate cyclase domain-containing protein [Ruegeria sp. Alg231-54]
MEKPRTRFTTAGDVAIAYQVVGDGPVDLIYASGWLHNIDLVWEHPGYNRFLSNLAEECRLILFDKRGTGMSDRDVGAPTLEERTDDIRAVMEAVGSEKAAIFGVSEGANMSTMFAAIYPERVSSLTLVGCYACRKWKPDWPYGMRQADFEKMMKILEESWGDLGEFLAMRMPSVAHDPAEIAFHNRLFLHSGSPRTAAKITRLNYELDMRPILPSIQAPTLVLQSRGDRSVSTEEAEQLAKSIPNANLKVLDREDHLPWIGDVDMMAKYITDFALSSSEPRPSDRVLATILISDIEGSTEAAAKMGDARWREVIDAHDAAAARAVTRYGGTLVKTMGDGILATFSGPSRAVECACELQREAAHLGLSVRAGVHSGECELRGDDISGIAVNVAARILDVTPGGACHVSSTVRDLTTGSGLEFAPAGTHEFKGVPGTWDLHATV